MNTQDTGDSVDTTKFGMLHDENTEPPIEVGYRWYGVELDSTTWVSQESMVSDFEIYEIYLKWIIPQDLMHAFSYLAGKIAVKCSTTTGNEGQLLLSCLDTDTGIYKGI